MAKNSFSLEGKLALITGGGTGIGLGIAKEMINASARVVITGRRKEVLEEAVAGLGASASYRVNDVTDKAAIPAFVEEIEDSLGAIDILVNNAGIHHKAMAQDTSDEDFERILQTNVMSVFVLQKSAPNTCLHVDQDQSL